MSRPTELRGCPLCGSGMLTFHVDPVLSVFVKCNECPMRVAFDPRSEYLLVGEWIDRAVQAWNRRPDATGAVERDSIIVAEPQEHKAEAGGEEDEP